MSVVQQLLSHSEAVVASSINMVTKEAAVEIMASDIDPNMIERVEVENPFRDIIEFVIKNQDQGDALLTEIKSAEKVEGVYSANLTQDSSPLIKVAFIPAAILILLLSCLVYILLGALIEGMIRKNQPIISSLSNYGSDVGYLKGEVSKMLFGDLIKGWFLGVFLFILSVYLFFSSVSQSFSDIGLGRILIVIILPLVIILFLMFTIVNFKFDKYLNQSNNG